MAETPRSLASFWERIRQSFEAGPTQTLPLTLSPDEARLDKMLRDYFMRMYTRSRKLLIEMGELEEG